jgi:hypothetical protein
MQINNDELSIALSQLSLVQVLRLCWWQIFNKKKLALFMAFIITGVQGRDAYKALCHNNL